MMRGRPSLFWLSAISVGVASALLLVARKHEERSRASRAAAVAEQQQRGNISSTAGQSAEQQQSDLHEQQEAPAQQQQQHTTAILAHHIGSVGYPPKMATMTDSESGGLMALDSCGQNPFSSFWKRPNQEAANSQLQRLMEPIEKVGFTWDENQWHDLIIRLMGRADPFKLVTSVFSEHISYKILSSCSFCS